MKKLLLLIVLIACAKSSFGQTSLDVCSFGGAIPDDGLDDRAAIQKTIDSVENAGGGVVTFPSGTFIVSLLPDPDPAQVISLQIYSNIKLKGAGKNKTIIKLVDNAGNFDAMISCKPSWETITNFQMLDLTVDENGGNNSTPSQTILANNGSRSAFRLFLGRRIAIENCEFTNIKGVWGLVFNGIIDTVIVNNNVFSNIGDPFIDWDHSTIYTHGQNFTITNNQISSLHGAGTFGARTGIEIHGGNQYVANNIIRGMTGGLNVTGYVNFGYVSSNQTYYKNTITDALFGFTLWSGLGDDPSINVGLEKVLFENNLVELNPEGWLHYQYYSGGSGFYFDQTRDRDMRNIYFIHNEVRYIHSSNVADAQNTSAVRMGKNNTSGIKAGDLYFLDNVLQNSFGPGIYLADNLQQSVFSNNTLVNCGCSASSLSNSYRSGFYLGGTFDGLIICNNTINDNQPAPVLKMLICNNGFNSGNCIYYNNSTNVNTASPFVNNPGSEGAPWLNTISKPIIFLNKDSLFIERASSDSLKLILSKASTDTVTTTVYMQDYLTTESSVFDLPQKQFVFLPGDSVKTIPLKVMNNTSIKGRINAELIVGYTKNAFPGAIQHCKINVPPLNNDNSAPSAPTGLAASDIGMNSFQLNWNASADNFGVARYEIYLNGDLFGATSSDTFFVASGLKPNTIYKVSVNASDSSDNMSSLSSQLSVTTLSDTLPPSVPSGLASKLIFNTSFTLTWSASTDNDIVTEYDVYIDSLYYGSSTGLRMNITGLKPGTTYSLTVQAKDAAGNVSMPSQPLMVKTTGIATGIESVSKGSPHVEIYPNPVNGKAFTVSLENFSSDREINFFFYDVTGKLVFSHKVLNQKSATLNLPEKMVDGIYLMKASCEEKSVTIKIIIK